MTDRELLELAAKAAGTKIDWIDSYTPVLENGMEWNSLGNDADALRLAVKLNLFNTRPKGYKWPNPELFLEHNDDPYAATRKAITRAAAEIGKSL